MPPKKNTKSKTQPLAVVILAAGKGSRMKSNKPKVMHQVAGLPIINWVIKTAESLNPQKIIVVTAQGMDDVQKAAAPHICVIQKTQNGTGDAVKPALAALKNFKGRVLVLLGDEPFLNKAALKKMINHDAITVMGVRPQSVTGLGRMIVNEDGTLDDIIEEKDCTPAQKKIDLANAGNFCIPAKPLEGWLKKLRANNAQKEYYLTDLPKIAQKDGVHTHVIEVNNKGALCWWGINTRAELAAHEAEAQNNLRAQMMKNGVTLIDPNSVTFAHDTKIAADTIIEPNVYIGKGVKIGSDVTIYSFSHSFSLLL